jgi:hypothetical protein
MPVLDGLESTRQIRSVEHEWNAREAADFTQRSMLQASGIPPNPAACPVSSPGAPSVSPSPDLAAMASPGTSSPVTPASPMPAGTGPSTPGVEMGSRTEGSLPAGMTLMAPHAPSWTSAPSLSHTMPQEISTPAPIALPPATFSSIEPESSHSSHGSSRVSSHPHAAQSLDPSPAAPAGSMTMASKRSSNARGQHGHRMQGPKVQHIPIIACTASAMDSDAEVCRLAGMDGQLGTTERAKPPSAAFVEVFAKHSLYGWTPLSLCLLLLARCVLSAFVLLQTC